VPIGDVPYILDLKSLNNKYNSYKANEIQSESDPKLFFMRISAINSEVGEGPYSNIIQLRKLNKGKLFDLINARLLVLNIFIFIF
jgi:hypothetical protein